MSHTLVSFLGKARLDPNTGYRTANYQFEDGSQATTPFFGLALKDHLSPDRLVLLGTRGSMWDVLIEHLSSAGQDEDLRLQLMDAAASSGVTQALLDRVTPLVEHNLNLPCHLELIEYGRNLAEQTDILQRISAHTPAGRVSLDVTHGFRHLAALGMLSSFFLERIQRLAIHGLYYGALDMTSEGITPVIRLDGLLAVQRWIDALDRFDQNGDYAVFAPLLEADGLPTETAHCLQRAAYFERTMNLSDARAQIQTFLPNLNSPLPGASGLFQAPLQQRLAWARNGSLYDHQTRLARFYLSNADYLRASLFAYEAVVTRECKQRQLDPHDYLKGREPAFKALEAELVPNTDTKDAYWMLKNLRNSLAHGNPATIEHYRRIIADPDRLPRELEGAMGQMLNTTKG